MSGSRQEETSLINLQVRSEKCLNNRLMLLTQKREIMTQPSVSRGLCHEDCKMTMSVGVR